MITKSTTSYLGCYEDQVTRDLDRSFVEDGQQTVEKCIALCSQKNFLYAGVQYGYEKK